MACGVFVALATHTLMHTDAARAGADARAGKAGMYRRLSRVFALAAVFGYARMLTMHRGLGSFAALDNVSVTFGYIAPFILAALACAVLSYRAARRPLGAVRVAEFIALAALGAVLSMPAVHVLAMLERTKSAHVQR